MSTPYTPQQDFLQEWQHWRDEASKATQQSWRPAVVMNDVPAPPPYKAELCIRNNPDSKTQYDTKIARAIITNTATNQIVYDYGKWVQEHYVAKALNNAITELISLGKARTAAKATP